MNFNQSVEYIHSLLAFGIKPGLERISMLLDLLDNPQDKLKIVHIAGTNGKGSTSTTISNMLIASGKKTGLFTSPYVIDFCERIQIDGENVSKNLFAECVTEVREKIEELNEKMEMPKFYFSEDCQDEVFDELIKNAMKEANPLYPVPKLWGKEEFIEIYRKLKKC